MIYGIGIDIIEIERIDKILQRSGSSFIKKIFTDEEINRIPSTARRKAEYLAGRFAGKEAVAKALGTGIGKQLNWKDIEILAEPSGKPSVKLSSVNHEKEKFQIHISISHSQSMAMAKVIIEQI